MLIIDDDDMFVPLGKNQLPGILKLLMQHFSLSVEQNSGSLSSCVPFTVIKALLISDSTSLLKIFVLRQVMKIFLCENSLPVQIYTGNNII